MHRPFSILLGCLVLTGCLGADFPAWKNQHNPKHDFDGDGFDEEGGDCDDGNADIHPNALEICGGIDENCNDIIDENPVDAKAFYVDGDGDSFGQSLSETWACEKPAGPYVDQGGDCDDVRADVNPNGQERCDGGTDEDCDGLVDLEDDSVDGDQYWYRDRDSDGFGDPLNEARSCTALEGYVLDPQDCDDTEPRMNPIHDEECDGLDNDCDGEVDEDADVIDATTWHRDADGDGFGDEADFHDACEAPDGHVAAPANGAFDCNESDSAVSPGAVETCNEIDDDCDGIVDESVTDTFYADFDADGFAQNGATLEACSQPSGYLPAPSLEDLDCDDTDAAVNPGASERCGDSVDNNCDGAVDEDAAVDAPTWHIDADGDGFGNPDVTVARCVQPLSYVADATDCDDLKAGVYPGAQETCLTLYDDNCDGDGNDAGATGCVDWFADADADWFGDATDTVCQCWGSTTHSVTDATDCDDSAASVNPGQLENCATPEDDDCTGSTNDEFALACAGFYYDFDGDGFGLDSDGLCLCEAQGYHTASVGGECDDNNPAVNPGAQEACFDSVDNDCSGTADGADATDAATWYVDSDTDGFGAPDFWLVACDQPSGYVADGTDCDDGRANVNTTATETCLTAYDDNCDGSANDLDATSCQDFYLDADADGYGIATDTVCRCAEDGSHTSRVPTDCNDGDAGISPAQTETCDTADDENCNGQADEAGAENCTDYFHDADGDGYGINDTVCTCTMVSPYTATSMGDCNEADASVNVGYGNCGLMGDVTTAEATAYTSGGAEAGPGYRAFTGGFDYNDDGYDDLLFGGGGYDSVYTDIGAAYLFLGPVTGNLDISGPGAADLFFSRTAGASSQVGSYVSAGDFDGDGAVELLVSGYGAETLWVIDDGLTGLGALNETSFGVSQHPYYATAESIGDVDYDGTDDAIFCGRGQLGDCYVAYGSSTGLAVDTGVGFYVTSQGGYAHLPGWPGSGPTSGGDVNGDGVSDLARNAGTYAYVHLGAENSTLASSADVRIAGTNGSYTVVEVLSDITGDGYGDLAVTHSRATVYDSHLGYIIEAGIMAILPGGTSLPASTATDTTNTRIIGDSDYVNVGFTVAGADVDGDGVGDVLVTAGQTGGEYTRLFYGPLSTGVHTIGTADAAFTQYVDSLGVANAGDTNGDGFEDVLVGRIQHSTGAFLYLGAMN